MTRNARERVKIMRRALALDARRWPACVAVAIVGGSRRARRRRSSRTLAHGGGGDVPVPVDLEVDSRRRAAYGININYSPIGSGGGIAAITARTVDFGASDAPLSTDQLDRLQGLRRDPVGAVGDLDPVQPAGNQVRRPAHAGALSGIYLGEITKWNDPKITANNGSCNLPDLKITPVYRSDNSGSTYAFTDYLSNVNSTWKSKVGTGVNAQWPAGVGARGSSGVAGVVTKTPGALTYVDIAYSLANKLRVGWVQNKAGKFTRRASAGIQAAASVLPKKITDFTQLKLVDPPKSAGNLAYPISTFTYVIAPTASSKAADLRKFIYWAVTRGQTFGKPLLFQPLPGPGAGVRLLARSRRSRAT